MATQNEICRMDAVTLAGLVRSKRLSPVEVVDAALARIERLEPILHAFCTPTADLALAEPNGSKPISWPGGRPASWPASRWATRICY
jgi:Asp-tRNA(Asn)/Glu-tRNA(Gln) amidotransferase A subunit family amidase